LPGLLPSFDASAMQRWTSFALQLAAEGFQDVVAALFC